MMKEAYIARRYVILPVFLVFLVSCTNPVLKWIGDFPIDTKDIIRFSLGVPGENVQIGSSPDENGKIPIVVTVPPATDLTKSLAPTIFHNGASVSGPGFTTLGGPRTVRADTGIPFEESSNPIQRTYTVRAENGSTAEYVVTVLHGQNPDPVAFDDSEKIITGFYFTNPLAVGAIDQDKHEIAVTVPSGTNIRALVPIVYYRGVSLSPASGLVQDFRGLQGYTVTAGDGTSLQYTVRVTVKLSSAKDIVGFSFNGVWVSKTVIGAVPGPDGKTPISVMVAGLPDFAALVPQINHTGQSIDLAPGSLEDFTGPVSYRVTAEDGSTKDYTVTVYFAESGKVITGFSFDDPLSKGKQILGQINQAAHTIEVLIPPEVWSSVNSLAPTISYFGASISYSGTSVSRVSSPGFQLANPFTDSPRTFTEAGPDDPIIYTVKATDGSTQDYALIIVKEEASASNSFVEFKPISDLAGLMDYNFNRATGLVTITSVSVYTPYEWYFDGVSQGSGVKNSLVINTGELIGGRQYEVILVVTDINVTPHKHYTNKLSFTVNK
jgi:hypothetical protein